MHSGPWLPPPAFVNTGVSVRPEMAGRQLWPPVVGVVWPQLPGLSPALLDNILRVSGLGARAPFPSGLLVFLRHSCVSGEGAEDTQWVYTHPPPRLLGHLDSALTSFYLPASGVTPHPLLAWRRPSWSHVTKTVLTHLLVTLPGLVPAVDPEPLLETPPASPEQEALPPPAACLATWPPVTLVLSSTSSSRPCPGLWDSTCCVSGRHGGAPACVCGVSGVPDEAWPQQAQAGEATPVLPCLQGGAGGGLSLDFEPSHTDCFEDVDSPTFTLSTLPFAAV